MLREQTESGDAHVAGSVNTALALWLGAALPGTAAAPPALALGLLGYGVSLVLFVPALRGLGGDRVAGRADLRRVLAGRRSHGV